MRVRRIWRSVVIAALIAGPLQDAAAVERTKLGGYENLQFGTPEAELRKQVTIVGEWIDPNSPDDWLTTADHVAINEGDYKINLLFRESVLVEVDLVWISAMDMWQCKSSFELLVGTLQAKYGEPDSPPISNVVPAIYIGRATFTFQDGGRIDVFTLENPELMGRLCKQGVFHKASGIH